MIRGCRPELLYENGGLKNFAKIQRKTHLRESSF